MTGYLQRLLDPALPASPPVLTPVVKSASPVFEQNQLLGLTDLHAGERDAEVAQPVGDVPGWRSPLPAGAPRRVPAVEIRPRNPQPATPATWPDPEPGLPMGVDPLPPRPAAARATTPPLHRPPDTVPEPARRDLEIFAPAPPREPGLARADAEQVAAEATPRIGPETTSQPETEERPAAPQVVTRDARRDLEPLERAPDGRRLPSVLEPRPRPDFDDRDADPHQAQSEPLPTPPRITIGRVTVELVPDHAPVAKPARARRTAETASVIGPLGNRRARRRLFALSRP